MFSLQTKEGENVLLDALDPEANGISFRIDRGSRSQLEIEGFELASQANFDRIEIMLPGTKPLGGPEASDFEATWCLTRKPGIEPTRFSLREQLLDTVLKHIGPDYVPLLPTRIRSSEFQGVGGYVLGRINPVHSFTIFLGAK
ncbi:hypothetical protein BS47DRAFT_1341783 [Hydnum rufescens UP504]|uniref:Uncharacterized protein n=1 Tax=Hydnum rufescens UP504 TaxID=1448309 RepID=A0A9P6DVR9_9AGAM|nr:hypothetical protein BS47DRAFT_1341783 [Hydnum rufescens UP504]